MSTAARDEAIVIVEDVLANRLPEHRDESVAERIVDTLLETHSISRNAPRVHRPSDDQHPQAQIRRMMAGEV